jgi:hypothetical protein
MTVQLIFFNTVTSAATATALSLYDLVTDTSLSYALSKNLPGQCVSLNFSANVDIKVGFSAAQLSESLGATLAANTPFVDSASGVSGNTIPIGQIFIYTPTSSGDATVTCYLRFIG